MLASSNPNNSTFFGKVTVASVTAYLRFADTCRATFTHSIKVAGSFLPARYSPQVRSGIKLGELGFDPITSGRRLHAVRAELRSVDLFELDIT